jgi:hypothetical protein
LFLRFENKEKKLKRNQIEKGRSGIYIGEKKGKKERKKERKKKDRKEKIRK